MKAPTNETDIRRMDIARDRTWDYCIHLFQSSSSGDRFTMECDTLTNVVWLRHDYKVCGADCSGCMFCDGGLSWCNRCKKGECDLTTPYCIPDPKHIAEINRKYLQKFLASSLY